MPIPTPGRVLRLDLEISQDAYVSHKRGIKPFVVHVFGLYCESVVKCVSVSGNCSMLAKITSRECECGSHYIEVLALHVDYKCRVELCHLLNWCAKWLDDVAKCSEGRCQVSVWVVRGV